MLPPTTTPKSAVHPMSVVTTLHLYRATWLLFILLFSFLDWIGSKVLRQESVSPRKQSVGRHDGREKEIVAAGSFVRESGRYGRLRKRRRRVRHEFQRDFRTEKNAVSLRVHMQMGGIV